MTYYEKDPVQGDSSTEVEILGRRYDYCRVVKDNKHLRTSFDALAKKTFGLSFEQWYKNGWWREKYIPHSLVHNGEVVANVSANIIDTLHNGSKKRFIQLGTVMTDKKYRSQGLSRFLMNAVVAEWDKKCDGIYLYANDSVLGFYPRFGFRVSYEHRYSVAVAGNGSTPVKLNMDNKDDVALLLKKYQSGNPYSRLQTVGCEGLLMFYCSQFMKNDVYYIRELDTAVIAEYDGDSVTICDIFGDSGKALIEIIPTLAGLGTKRAVLGFTPLDASGFECSVIEKADTTFFVHNSSRSIFNDEKTMFPLLSHA